VDDKPAIRTLLDFRFPLARREHAKSGVLSGYPKNHPVAKQNGPRTLTLPTPGMIAGKILEVEIGPMQAIVYQRYGSPDVLELEDIPIPTPAEGQVLIRVHAASVNPYDWHFLRGTPSFIRLFIGMRRPKFPRLGADVAGVVEAVGAKAARFKPGDAVFGTAKGSFAEYACAAASQLALKPQEISFEQGACLPIAGVTALQGLRDKGKVQTEQTVLINGAAGGVGTFAVQIAKSFGARVTACAAPEMSSFCGRSEQTK